MCGPVAEILVRTTLHTPQALHTVYTSLSSCIRNVEGRHPTFS